MASAEPNWSLLPSQPLDFFGLEVGFDRKDLKRAYGRLIKKFKPETHPAEFQRIRSAYEVLESQNRYGVRQAAITQMSSAWEMYSSGRPDQPKIKVADVIEDAINDPVETYRRLSKKSPRTPQEFYLLATLADVVDRSTANKYLNWLLTGIRDHPNDPGLQRLTREYLDSFMEADAACSALHSLSKLVDGSDFFPMTESLWSRLLGEIPFDKFARVLAACEKNLKHSNLRSKQAFYIQIIRRAIAKAPAEWIDQRLEYLNQHGSELDGALDQELEFTTLVREYFKQDRESLLSKPAGKTLDRLIEAYCSDNSVEGTRKVALLCDELARNGNAMIDSFPSTSDESTSRVLLLCAMIVSDVASESGLEFPVPDPKRLQRQADATVSDLEKTIESVGSRIGWMRVRHYGIPMAVIVGGPIYLMYGISGWFLISLVWVAFSLLGFFAVLVPQWLSKKADEKTFKVLVREYDAQWRPRLVRYVQGSHARSMQSIEQLRKSAYDLGQSEIIEVILSYAANDRTLHLLNQLQLFVH